MAYGLQHHGIRQKIKLRQSLNSNLSENVLLVRKYSLQNNNLKTESPFWRNLGAKAKSPVPIMSSV